MAFLTGSEIYILRTVQTNHDISWSIYLLHTYIKQFYKSHNAHHHWCQLHAWCMISYLPLLDIIIAGYLCHPWLLHYFGGLLKIHSNQTGHLQQLQRITSACILYSSLVCNFYLIFLSNESGYEVHIVLVHPLHHLHHIQSYQYHHCWKPPWHYCDYCPSSPSSACGLGPRLSSVHLLKTSFQRSN